MSLPLSSVSSSNLNRRNSSLGTHQANQVHKATGNRFSMPLQGLSRPIVHGPPCNSLRSISTSDQENRQAQYSVKLQNSQLLTRDAESLLHDCSRRINAQFQSSPEVWYRFCKYWNDFNKHRRTVSETRGLFAGLLQETAPGILRDLTTVLQVFCSRRKALGPQTTHSEPPSLPRTQGNDKQIYNKYRQSQVPPRGLLLPKASVKRGPSLPSTSRSQPKTKVKNELLLPDLVDDFIQEIQGRFPNRPEICDHFENDVLGPIFRGKAAEDLIPYVSDLFRRAPELVRTFKRMMDTFDRLPEHSAPSGSSALYAISADDDSDSGLSRDNGDSELAGQIAQKGHHEDIQKLLVLPDIYYPPELRKQTPRQMTNSCLLMEHQKTCLTWLLRQEEDRHKKGGLLADTMGLGKTVQALALILARPSRDPLRRTTLIVAPLALLRQWEREIATKVQPAYALKTVIFHGPKTTKMTVPQLLGHDVILCTYGKLQHEYKIKHERNKTSKLKILHPRAKFYRVILDEAHNIRNKNTKSSLGAAEIQSQYRLCMTGTPFMNRAAEIYPLIRFLGIPPYNDWNRFSEDINTPIKKWDGNEREEGMVKLQALFRSITLRRTKDSLLDGKPIINVPAREEELALAEFDQDQRDFYLALERKQQVTFNKYLAAGTVMKNYTYILVLILRLRQACNHPFLIKDHGIPEGTKLGADEMIRLACKLPENTVTRIKAQDRFQCPLCAANTENPVIVHPCGHYICAGCFTVSMTESEGIDEYEDDEGGPMIACPGDDCDNKITPSNILCYNFFVDAHMSGDSESESEANRDESKSEEDISHEIDEVDENGNLKDFIVDSGEEGSMADHENGSDDDGSELEEVDEIGRRESNTARGFSTEETSKSSANNEAGTVESTYVTDDSVAGDVVKKDVSRGLRGKLVDIDSSSDDESTIKWKRDQFRRSLQLNKAFDDDGDIPDIQLEARPPKRKSSAGKAADTSRKKSRSEAQSNYVGPDEVGTTPDPRRDGRGVVRNNKAQPNTGRPRSKRESKKGKSRRKGNDFLSLGQMKRNAQSSAASISRYKKRLRKEFVSSCKIDKTMEILEDIREQKPDEKTLVFSLWPSFLDLLEIPMEKAGFHFTRYDGSMKADERDAAVTSLMEDPRVKIMLVSLTAGNAGLNLTAASQVIIIEPFWNPFVEEQAIDRAHRIGQKREVTIHRIHIPGTIEDRIIELQASKKALVNTALCEKGAQSVSKLGLVELKRLFNCR